MLSVCCSSEEPIQVPVKVGEEVKFGLSLEGTRTVYGPETTADGRTYFPIYWSEGDKVQIYSPDCPEGRNQAEYSVKPVAGQSYAESLTKTGSNGVQWGENATAKFYSVYPSANSTFAKVNGNVTATLNISSSQTANYILTDGVYNVADMNNVVMYAQTEAINSGNDVYLQYNPFSTVLDFEIEATVGTEASALVQSIKLEATENITGKFTLTFDGAGEPTVATAGDNGKVIEMNFGVKPELKSGANKLRVKMNLMPVDFDNINNWKVTLTLLEGGEEKTFAKTLSSASTVVAGKIHKVKLPVISITEEWLYKPEVWMTQIPEYQTVYLTEYSIPGAWYAHDPAREGYQESGETIERLWTNGIRAFAIECRSSANPTLLNGFNTDPVSVVMSGTGSAAGILGSYYSGGTKIQQIIKLVADQVAKTEEFAVLVLSYADGGTDGQRDIDHNFFINGLKNEIANSGATNIYNKEITPNTTTADVMGQLIIKVNVDEELSKQDYDGSSNALFSYVPHMYQLSSSLYSTPLFSKIYWKTWEDSYETYIAEPTSEFLWCFSSANRTHVDGDGAYEIPTYAQRKESLNAMMEHSDEIYKNSTHNVWFYFNVGGTEAEKEGGETAVANFATQMNPWLLNVVNLKTYGGTDDNGNLVSSNPSPLGIVMFNNCTSAPGKQIVQAIIEMNNKVDLKRAEPKTKGAYDGTVNYGGNAITTK